MYLSNGFDASNDKVPHTITITKLPSRGELYQTLDGITRVNHIEKTGIKVNDPHHRVIYYHFSNVKDDDYFEFDVQQADGPKQTIGVQIKLQGEDTKPCYKEDEIQIMGEVGRVDATHAEVHVDFQQEYINPVVIAQPISYNGHDVTVPRISLVTGNGFTVQLQEASNHDGSHTHENFSYIVMEAGAWRMPDADGKPGKVLEAGKIVTAKTAASGSRKVRNRLFESVHYSDENMFVKRPVVITQVQTKNDPDLVKTRQQHTTTSAFQVTLEEEETNRDSHGAEIVGWISMDTGVYKWSDLQIEAKRTKMVVGDKFYNIKFNGNSFQNNPYFVAILASFRGFDSAHLRFDNLSHTGVKVRVEEDTSSDTETKHTKEMVSYIAIQDTSTTLLRAYNVRCFVDDPEAPELDYRVNSGDVQLIDLLDDEQESLNFVISIESLPEKGQLFQYHELSNPSHMDENSPIDATGYNGIVTDKGGRVFYKAYNSERYDEDEFEYKFTVGSKASKPARVRLTILTDGEATTEAPIVPAKAHSGNLHHDDSSTSSTGHSTSNLILIVGLLLILIVLSTLFTLFLLSGRMQSVRSCVSAVVPESMLPPLSSEKRAPDYKPLDNLLGVVEDEDAPTLLPSDDDNETAEVAEHGDSFDPRGD